MSRDKAVGAQKKTRSLKKARMATGARVQNGLRLKGSAMSRKKGSLRAREEKSGSRDKKKRKDPVSTKVDSEKLKVGRVETQKKPTHREDIQHTEEVKLCEWGGARVRRNAHGSKSE